MVMREVPSSPRGRANRAAMLRLRSDAVPIVTLVVVLLTPHVLFTTWTKAMEHTSLYDRTRTDACFLEMWNKNTRLKPPTQKWGVLNP